MQRLATLFALLVMIPGGNASFAAARSGDPNAPWSVVSSPNRSGAVSNDLSGVSCSSARFCAAAGTFLDGNGAKTLIEIWNGTAWKIVPSPNVGSGADSHLNGISCASATVCVAVGYSSSGDLMRTLIESWDGNSWRIVPSPSSGTGSQLNDVSCVGAGSCTAVGSFVATGGDKTLIESSALGPNGMVWRIIPSPNLGTASNQLTGVACASMSFCAAVGLVLNGGGIQTLIESWDGAAWRIAISPNPGSDDQLNGVTCVSVSRCTAVGSYLNDVDFVTLVESWDGSHWSVVPSPNPSSDHPNTLAAVSCLAANSCMAVGNYNVSLNLTHTLVESWDGSAWSIVPSPNPGSQLNALNGVSCASATSCAAAGSSSNGVIDQSLIESWDGVAWSVATSPNAPGAVPNDLAGLSCMSNGFCVAVGTYVNGGVPKTLILSRNAITGWAIAPSPNVGSLDNHLFGVSCLSASSCTAVGSFFFGGVGQTRTLIESWNGIAWKVVPSPSSGTENDQLAGVSCVSASFCMAVGDEELGGQTSTLIENWNGSAWSVVPSPNPGQSILRGVSCVSATFCTAVGDQGQTLVESWDGTKWSVVPSPNPGPGDRFRAVSCLTNTSCTAVGDYSTNGSFFTLIESWNGTAWSVVPSPSPPSDDFLNGVLCVSGIACAAVGFYFGPQGSTQTLIESWDGHAWSVTPSPSPGTTLNQLNVVSCVSASSCTSVGSYNNRVDQTLIEAISLPRGPTQTERLPGFGWLSSESIVRTS